jgi:hypothetical protein
MGDQLRFSLEGPRGLSDPDLRGDGKPKVVVNLESDHIVAKSNFEPVVDPIQHQRLLHELERRSGSQRGKPRSRTPGQNPLGCRVFDMGCGWPMYRQPFQKSFRYLCGLYQQSHGAKCRHNHVDGMSATQFMLGCIRQRLLTPAYRGKLEKRLRELAERDRNQVSLAQSISSKRAALLEMTQKRQRVAENLALAETESQHRAIATIFDEVAQKVESLELELRQAEQSVVDTTDLGAAISVALEKFDRLADLAADADNLEAIGELFQHLNARLFLQFEESQPKKRTLNKVAGGVVTFGASPPPVGLYEGPTGRRAFRGIAETTGCMSGITNVPARLCGTDREGMSLGNVNRGDWI